MNNHDKPCESMRL